MTLRLITIGVTIIKKKTIDRFVTRRSIIFNKHTYLIQQFQSFKHEEKIQLVKIWF